MIAVKFNKMMQPYRTGEVAGLPDAAAARAIAQGYATRYDPKARAPEPPARRAEPQAQPSK